jgi:hypothetical protein
MTDAEKAIFWKLSTDVSVTDLCASGRIQPSEVKEGTTFPRIIYNSDLAYVNRTMSGTANPRTDNLTITCEALSAADARTLGAAIFNVLENKDSRSTGTDGTWNGVVVQGVFCSGEKDDVYKIGSAGQESTIYYRQYEFVVWYVAD